MSSTEESNHEQAGQHALSKALVLVAGAAVSALQPPRLLLGVLAVACIAIGGSLLDAVGTSSWQRTIDAAHTEDAQQRLQAAMQDTGRRLGLEEASDPPTIGELRTALRRDFLESRGGLEDPEERLELESRYLDELGALEELEPCGPFEATMRGAGLELGRFVEGVIEVRPGDSLVALSRLAYQIPLLLWSGDPFVAILLALLIGFCFALFGGAIARLDALETGLRLKPTAWDGLEFAWSNIQKLLQSVLLPLAVVAILSGLLAIVGIPFNLPVLDVLGGIIYGLSIALSLVSAVLLVGYGAMMPMLVGSVGVERCDAGESIQSSWGSVMARPGHFLLLLGAGLACFAIGLALVDVIVVLALDVAATSWGGIVSGGAMRSAGTFTALDFTFDNLPSTTSGTATAAGALVSFWEQLLIALLLGYVFSWIATIGTRLFLAMRFIVDKQSPSVIWLPGTLGGSTVQVEERPEARFESEDTFSEGPR